MQRRVVLCPIVARSEHQSGINAIATSAREKQPELSIASQFVAKHYRHLTKDIMDCYEIMRYNFEGADRREWTLFDPRTFAGFPMEALRLEPRRPRVFDHRVVDALVWS